MEPFPSQWKDTPKNRERWAQVQVNEAFLSQQRTEKGALHCHFCRKEVVIHHWSANYNGPDLATVDHVIPLSRGGSDHPSNMVVACRPCNLKKGDY